MVNEITIAVVCLLLLLAFMVFWIREKWFQKSNPLTYVSTPKVSTGRPQFKDTANIVGGYGEVIGGKMQTKDIITLSIQTPQGETMNHYYVDDIFPENVAGHLIGNDKSWIHLKDYCKKFGGEAERIMSEQSLKIEKLHEENNLLKSDNELLRANMAVQIDGHVKNVIELSKSASQPQMGFNRPRPPSQS